MVKCAMGAISIASLLMSSPASRIPIAFCLHSAVHMASLIGDRFSIIELSDPMAQIIRHYVELYGLGHKLVSIRTVGSSSTVAMKYINEYDRKERDQDP
jgi:Asp/Glu/hydantoin racemase